MKKRIIFFVVMFFSVLILSVKGGDMVGLGAFNKEVWSDKEFNDVVMEEIKSAQKILPQEPNGNVAYFGLSGHLFRFHPARRFGVIRPA